MGLMLKGVMGPALALSSLGCSSTQNTLHVLQQLGPAPPQDSLDYNNSLLSPKLSSKLFLSESFLNTSVLPIILLSINMDS